MYQECLNQLHVGCCRKLSFEKTNPRTKNISFSSESKIASLTNMLETQAFKNFSLTNKKSNRYMLELVTPAKNHQHTMLLLNHKVCNQARLWYVPIDYILSCQIIASSMHLVCFFELVSKMPLYNSKLRPKCTFRAHSKSRFPISFFCFRSKQDDVQVHKMLQNLSLLGLSSLRKIVATCRGF